MAALDVLPSARRQELGVLPCNQASSIRVDKHGIVHPNLLEGWVGAGVSCDGTAMIDDRRRWIS
jgi:hypothetical protein